MAISSTGTLLGNPFHPHATAAVRPTADSSAGWQLGPIPTDLDVTPWVFESPEVTLPRRRRWITVGRVLAGVVLLALAVGVLVWADPLTLGWHHAAVGWIHDTLRTLLRTG